MFTANECDGKSCSCLGEKTHVTNGNKLKRTLQCIHVFFSGLQTIWLRLHRDCLDDACFSTLGSVEANPDGPHVVSPPHPSLLLYHKSFSGNIAKKKLKKTPAIIFSGALRLKIAQNSSSKSGVTFNPSRDHGVCPPSSFTFK